MPRAKWPVGRAMGLAWLGMVWVVCSVLGAETPKSIGLIAADAPVYVEVTRPEAIIDRASSEHLQFLLKAVPGYDRALDDPKLKEFLQVVEFIAGQLDTTPTQAIRDLTGGGVVLGIEGENQAILVVTPSDPTFLQRAHDKLVELARKDAADKGNPDPIKQKEYRGITGYSVTPKEAHAIIDGMLVITSGGEMLKTVIDRVQDGFSKAKSIAANDRWSSRRDALGAEDVAWAFVRLDRLRELDPKRFAPEKIDPGVKFLFGPWIEAAREGDWASLSLAWTENRLGAELAVASPAHGYSDTYKRYIPPSGQGALPLLTPPGTVASLSLWRDLSAIWEVRTEIFPPETVQGLAQLDTVAGQFFGGRDFETGVLGALKSDWRLVVARQDVSKMNPVPDVKLPAFAIVIGLDPEDEDFAQRLKVAFQSFIGLANLGAAQQKAPPLMLGTEEFEGVTISKSTYMPPKDGLPAGEPVHQRFNFSPSAVQVGNHFVLSSSLGLAKDLVHVLQSPGESKASEATFLVEAEGKEVGGLIEQNRERLINQNMLEKGNSKEQAAQEVDLLKTLVEYLNHATLSVRDTEGGPSFQLNFDLKGE